MRLLKPYSDYIEPAMQRKICIELSHQFEQTTACNEFFQTLQETVARMQKRSRKPDPAVAADIRHAIIEQYRSLKKHRPRRETGSGL